MKTLLVDNYDSFTFNLYQQLAVATGAEPLVVRNDDPAALELAAAGAVEAVVLSPGPGTPARAEDAGICLELIRRCDLPMLGVCLGHQAIGHVFGAEVVRAPEPMHGRLCAVEHDGRDLFRDLPPSFAAVRYHSLVLAEPLAPELEVTARSADGLVMGLRHRQRPLWGLQFHPESICTEHGARLLQNFAALSRERRNPRPRATARAQPVSLVPGGRKRAATKFTHRLVVEAQPWVDPEAAFVSLFASSEAAFWLDSSLAGPDRARFSFMGDAGGRQGYWLSYSATRQVVTEHRGGASVERGTPLFDYLRQQLAAVRVAAPPDLPFELCGGFVGQLGYELKAECGAAGAHPSPQPDAALIFCERFIAFDHQERVTYVAQLVGPGDDEAAAIWQREMAAALDAVRAVGPPEPPAPASGPPPPTIAVALARSPKRYLDDIAASQRAIADGDSYELCLTNQLELDTEVEPLAYYRTLRRLNPAPYASFLRVPGLAVCSSSPERFLRIDRAGQVESKPIKGTRRRGDSPADDARRKDELQHSEKERAENLMIVDLVRHDLGSVCRIGSVAVPALMQVESYATVHQLTSTITGVLRDEVDAIDCVRQAFPGGSMTGAPKRRTMEILDRLEGRARGVYSGSIGFLSCSGTADLAITIRTAVLSGGRMNVGVGGAIVSLSDPAAELDEMLLKGRALLRALCALVYGEPCDRYRIAECDALVAGSPPC